MTVSRVWWGAVAVVGGFACEKATPSAEGPARAARCQLDAVATKNLDGWIACWHPTIRAEVGTELRESIARKPDFWDQMRTRAAGLNGVVDSQFAIEPLPPERAELGDAMAKLRLERDSFEAVRKAGRWYIVDSGI